MLHCVNILGCLHCTDNSVECSASQQTQPPPGYLTGIDLSLGTDEFETRPRCPLSYISTFFSPSAATNERSPNRTDGANRTRSSKLFSLHQFLL